MSKKPAPVSLLECILCNCKADNSCSTQPCQCRSNDLKCTDVCACLNYQNSVRDDENGENQKRVCRKRRWLRFWDRKLF